MTLTDMMTTDDKKRIIKNFVKTYEDKCRERMAKDVEGFYVFGSYAFGKINVDMPDINYFILLKYGADPNVFLTHGQILREMMDEFKDVARVTCEYRPFKTIYRPMNEGDPEWDIIINPQYGRMEDSHGELPFGWGWVLEGLLQTRKLLWGNDALKNVVQPPPTTEYILKYFGGCFSHLWLPIERTAAQYNLPYEYPLLFHETYKCAQNAAIGFGVNLAMTEEEHLSKAWMDYVYDKSKLIGFYRDRYDQAMADNIAFVLDVRDNWAKYKYDHEKAIKMHNTAINICQRLKAKYYEMVMAAFAKK